MERWRRNQLAVVSAAFVGFIGFTLLSGLVAAQRIRLVFVAGIVVQSVLSLIVARGMTSPASAASGPRAGN